MKNFILTGFVFFLLHIVVWNETVAQTQDTWTLEDCIRFALEHNLQLKRVELVALTSKQNYIQSKIKLLPSLEGFAQHSLSSGKTVNYDDYTYVYQKFQDGNLGAQSYMDLFNGFQQTNLIRRNKYNFLAAMADVDKQKNDLIIDLTLAYMKILYNEEFLEIAKAQYGIILQETERVASMVEVGNESQGVLLDIKSQAAAERLNVTTVKNQLKTSYLDLIQLLDLDSLAGFSIAKPVDILITDTSSVVSFKTVYNTAVANFPEIKSAEYTLKKQERNLAVTRGQRSPRIYLRGLIYSRYSELGTNPLDPTAIYPYIDQIKDNNYQQISVNLSVPIFQQWTIQNKISNAKITLKDAELNLNQTKQLLYKSIQQTHLDALAALEKYRSSTETVTSREMAFEYSREKLKAGIENATDYNTAKNNLIKAQAELLQAKYEFVFTTKILDFYMGTPVGF